MEVCKLATIRDNFQGHCFFVYSLINCDGFLFEPKQYQKWCQNKKKVEVIWDNEKW